jgi:hypothetical protein
MACVNPALFFYKMTDLSVSTDGFSSIIRTEGIKGLWRGSTLALFGVSNGAIQFMAYEEMKEWAFERKRKRFAKTGLSWTPAEDKLVSPISYAFLLMMLRAGISPIQLTH